VPTDRGREGATAAWTLVQAGALMRTAEELLVECLRTVGPDAHAGFGEDARLSLRQEEVEALHALLAELADVGDRLRVLGDCLPATGLELRYEDLREAATEDLASGVADPGRALLAARVLHLADGWPALADALRSGDAHADWHEVTVAQLLRRFRGVDATLVRSVLDDAGIGAEAPFADCLPEQLDALAAALEAHAAERR
jgi:hypothetical protein